MGDFSVPMGVVLPPIISSISRYSEAQAGRNSGGTSGGLQVDWVSGLAVYMPFSIPWPYPVQRIFWTNGSTITSTNVDCGIYNSDGVKLYATGSTAMVGTSVRQMVSVATPFVLAPGSYYFAWTCDNTTARGFTLVCASAPNTQRLAGLLEQTSAFPLPSTMTPVAFTRVWGCNYVGITRYSSGF